MPFAIVRRFVSAILVPILLVVFAIAAFYYESALAEVAGGLIYLVLAAIGVLVSAGFMAFYLLLRSAVRALEIDDDDKSLAYMGKKRCVQLAVTLGIGACLLFTALSVFEYVSGQVLVDYMPAQGFLFFHNQPGTHDPTYAELMAFIKNDTTDRTEYDINKFTCSNYAITVHDNAEKHGIRAGGVLVIGDTLGLSNYMSTTHAVNVFKTTDKGLVYVDCTEDHVSGFSDKIGYIRRGAPYRVINANRSESYSYDLYMNELKDSKDSSHAYNFDGWEVVYTAMLW